MTAALKALAVETKTAVVALSQLNRAPEREGRKPQLADLRDSGSIEQDADVILFLHKSGVDAVVPDAQIIIAKHRQGDTDEAQVSYHKPTMTYHARHIDPAPGQVLTEAEV